MSFDNHSVITISINIIAVLLLIIIIAVVSFLVKKLKKHLSSSSLKIDEIKLGIGDSQVTLVYDKKDKEIAYKLWVELTTRKIGMLFDEKNDVISEVYNSWYEFFKIARELMKEIPVDSEKNSLQLAELTEKVLNVGLRPHLTTWQARYRKWYDRVSAIDDRDPQAIQKEYEFYDELVEDLIKTNNHIIEYKKLMQNIAERK